MAHGFSPGHEVRERVAVGSWASGPGTFSPARSRFRMIRYSGQIDRAKPLA
jgi:hypothetical protein